jgi:hypothetical protein
MSWLNDKLEAPLRKVLASPHYKPVIAEIEAAQRNGATSSEIRDVAVKGMRARWIREGKKLDAEDIRSEAFLAASAAAVDKPYQLADAPEGEDKAQHLFVSGAISSYIDSTLDKARIIPGFVRKGLAVGLTMTVGFFKEVADILTSGFNTGDLKADWLGATLVFDRPTVPASSPRSSAGR